MDTDQQNAGTYLTVDTDGVTYHCDPDGLEGLQTKWLHWIQSGKTVDAPVLLTFAGGGANFMMLASTVRSFWVSTPETRRLNTAHNRRVEEEAEALQGDSRKGWEENDE